MSHNFPCRLPLREGNYHHLLYRQNYIRWDICNVIQACNHTAYILCVLDSRQSNLVFNHVPRPLPSFPLLAVHNMWGPGPGYITPLLSPSGFRNVGLCYNLVPRLPRTQNVHVWRAWYLFSRDHDIIEIGRTRVFRTERQRFSRYSANFAFNAQCVWY